MVEDFAHVGIPEVYQPATMSALLVDQQVYFSSSLRGAPYLVNPKDVKNYIQEGVANEVHLAIIRSQHQYNSEHRYDMKCGEPLACQQFLIENEGAEIIGKASVATYGVVDRDDKSQTAIMNPCSVSRKYSTFWV